MMPQSSVEIHKEDITHQKPATRFQLTRCHKLQDMTEQKDNEMLLLLH